MRRFHAPLVTLLVLTIQWFNQLLVYGARPTSLESSQGPIAEGANSVSQESAEHLPVCAAEAITVAIDVQASIVLVLYASAGDPEFAMQLRCLDDTIRSHGSTLVDAVAGIAVGSEDLHRRLSTHSDVMLLAVASLLVRYIDLTRYRLSNTILAKTPVGHVDSHDVWVQRHSVISGLVGVSDFVGYHKVPAWLRGDTTSVYITLVHLKRLDLRHRSGHVQEAVRTAPDPMLKQAILGLPMPATNAQKHPT